MQTPSGESMQYIVDSILDYIKRDKTSYAILLDGKWGSGKTYFWKNIMKKEIEETGKKVIYVSLYGVSNIEEIDKKILLGKWEFVEKINNSEMGGRITEIGKAAFGVIKKLDITGISEGVTNINYKELLNYSNTIICFDDLERVHMRVDEVLGYINNFVEHDGMKVIMIGNEEEIADKLNDQNHELKMLTTYFYLKNPLENDNTIQSTHGKGIKKSHLITKKLSELFHKQNEYKRIKEKLIGKTLTIQLDERSLIEDIINHTWDTELQRFLEHNMEIVETTFKESKTKNIRILKQGLEDFELIYQNCKKDKYNSDVMFKSLLKFVLAASYEIKTNTPLNEGLEKTNSNRDFEDSIGLSALLDGKSKKFPEEFQNKYYNGQGTVYQRKFFKFAEVLIRKGILNKELFKEEMDSFQSQINGRKIIDPHLEFIMGGYWKLSDDEFWEVEQSTYNKLKNGELHFSCYFRAYQMYKYFIRKNIIFKNIVDIKQELMEGLEKAGERGEDIVLTDPLFYTEENKNDPNLSDFKEKIIKINTDLKMEKKKEKMRTLVELMRTDFHEFYIKVSQQYKYEPLFVYCDPEEMYANIINLSADNINTIRGLIRSRIVLVDEEHNKEMKMELSNLKIIKSRLNAELNKRTKTPRLILLEHLVEELEEFENKVNDLKSTNQ
ncbi:P-loop NTPase fold protein [Bacillus cereus]